VREKTRGKMIFGGLPENLHNFLKRHLFQKSRHVGKRDSRLQSRGEGVISEIQSSGSFGTEEGYENKTGGNLRRGSLEESPFWYCGAGASKEKREPEGKVIKK